ncbi:MAG: YwaF family protein [Bifidobacteriaceae bacterium]|jgi:hypothetical protein|nr:YwaF family protein [Bifidobacteriaceae bacterium]
MAVEPFNAVWFAFLGTMALFGVALHLALRHRSRAIQVKVCVALAAATVVLYTFYTFKSILNPRMPEVVFWQNLPFHFCNLVAWGLIPAYLMELHPPRAAWARRGLNMLRTVCYFPGALAGLLTLTSPVIVYIGHPLCSVEAIGFYGVHSMNVILGTLLGSLGFIRPTLRGAVASVGYMLAFMVVVVFPLDAVMRATVDPNVNYFYLFNPEDAEILEMSYAAIGVPVLYMIPLVPVALTGTVGQALLYKLVSRLARAVSGRSGQDSGPDQDGRGDPGSGGQQALPTPSRA